MKIGILGGGSIGLLVGSYLAEKHEVTIYVRRVEQKTKINTRGMRLSGLPVAYAIKALLIEEMREEDCLFLCVKQSNVSDVLAIIGDENKNTPIIFLQNGMGHVNLFKEITQPLYVGVVEHGAYRINDYKVNHTGKGVIKLALFNGRTEQLQSLITSLSRLDFPFTYSDDWQLLLAEKLVINAVINPLTTLFDIRNGEILKNPYILYLAEQLCREASAILNLDFPIQWKQVQKVAESTAKNTSSMLSDIQRNTQTENDAISGYLINESKEHCPYTSFIYNSIKALEMKHGIVY